MHASQQLPAFARIARMHHTPEISYLSVPKFKVLHTWCHQCLLVQAVYCLDQAAKHPAVVIITPRKGGWCRGKTGVTQGSPIYSLQGAWLADCCLKEVPFLCLEVKTKILPCLECSTFEQTPTISGVCLWKRQLFSTKDTVLPILRASLRLGSC